VERRKVFKMKILIYFCLLGTYFDFNVGKVLILPEELVEKCPENADNDAGYFGVDAIDIVVESDTDIFLNGSVKILKELKSPWLAEYYAEQFYRDTWVRSPIQRKFDDLCLSFHSPKEIWYKILKDVPECPFEADVNITRTLQKVHG
jgi:hypothetical protein